MMWVMPPFSLPDDPMHAMDETMINIWEARCGLSLQGGFSSPKEDTAQCRACKLEILLDADIT